MNMRIAALGAALAVAVVGALPFPAGAADPAKLPIPPVPPRIAEGEDYDACLSMLTTDPAGARDYAEGWEATTGDIGATHCLALAVIALGDAEAGADMLQKLATDATDAPAVARATVYGQAAQAWLIASNPGNAYAAGTLALSLSPDDPDLLIDRAITASALERFDDAAEDLDHALAIDPQRPDALVLLGSAERHLGDLDAAQDDIDRALAMDEDNAEALLERGIIRQRRSDFAGAQADWEHVLDLAPDTPTADLAQQNLALLEAGPEQK